MRRKRTGSKVRLEGKREKPGQGVGVEGVGRSGVNSAGQAIQPEICY